MKTIHGQSPSISCSPRKYFGHAGTLETPVPLQFLEMPEPLPCENWWLWFWRAMQPSLSLFLGHSLLCQKTNEKRHVFVWQVSFQLEQSLHLIHCVAADVPLQVQAGWGRSSGSTVRYAVGARLLLVALACLISPWNILIAGKKDSKHVGEH